MDNWFEKVSCIAAFVLCAETVSAADVQTIENARNGNESVAELYLSGVGDGLQAANTFGSDEWNKPLFCAPEKISLNSKNYLDIYVKELARVKAKYKELDKLAELDVTPASIILTIGLVRAFPCK